MFAGVGGVDIGLDQAGLECCFQVEIDASCQQTLSYHWPNVKKYGDILEVSGYDLQPVDLIVFGSPCQDLSTAGKKSGLNGEKSSLFYEATRIIKEMRENTNGQYPKWSIWENVTGALSSNNGSDFGQVLYEMDEAGACFSEWAVLDAQYFGVPQRRRRIYLVSVYDTAIAARCPDKIFSIQESGSGNIEKSFKEKQKPSTETINSFADNSPGEQLVDEVVGPLQARDYKGIGNQYVKENKLVVQSFTPSSHAQYAEGVGTLRANGGDIGGGSETIIVFSHTQGLDPQTSFKNSPTLRREGGGAAVLESDIVRRLTPLECERLMGWPDNHTLYRADGKNNSDSARYKMCGNGVASPVIKWIADQIKEI